jgi:hypothetical protein
MARRDKYLSCSFRVDAYFVETRRWPARISDRTVIRIVGYRLSTRAAWSS